MVATNLSTVMVRCIICLRGRHRPTVSGSLTKASFRLMNLLYNVDLPTFGRPTRATCHKQELADQSTIYGTGRDCTCCDPQLLTTGRRLSSTTACWGCARFLAAAAAFLA